MLASFVRYCAPWGISLLIYAISALPGNAQTSIDQAQPNFGAAVSVEQLEEARGGTYSFSKSQIDIIGNTEGNTAYNVITGNNIIDAGSFQQMSGMPVVVQNSGANVLIQNAVIVNMEMN